MDKITVENVNHPGQTTRVNAGKYQAMRTAMLAFLAQQQQPADYKTIREGVKPLLPERIFPGGATAGWWIKCVQLDLEAKGQLVRTRDKPLRFTLPGR
ncbi:DUF6958 family protein [Hoeflea sp.]|uniref:DUF6958 family protein n=1 Tax=Hoeflea sp. TaxID=1940281 RepID=UPI003A9424A2